jgi:hypothetical protein
VTEISSAAPPAPPAMLPDAAEGEFVGILIGAYGDGRRSSYWALDGVISPFGVRAGAVAGPETAAMDDLIPPLISHIWRRGSGFRADLCRAFYKALPWCAPLRDWISRYQAGDLPLVSEDQARESAAERERIATVADAFDSIRALGDPVLERQIAQARDDLQDVSDKLLVLHACKSIHDALHGVQTSSYPELMQLAAKEESLSPADLDVIGTQYSRLDNAAIDIDTNLTILSDDRIGDSAWLADFRDAYSPLARQSAVPADIETALYGLRAVLRQQLPRFDAAIVTTAKSVPFGPVVEFLRVAAGRSAKLAGATAALDDAAAKLAGLDADLRGAVELHEAWQQVDAPFWLIEQELRPSIDPAQLERVRLQWRAALRRLDTVRDCSPTLWDTAIEGGLTRVSDLVATETGLSPDAAAALAGFIRLARLVFLRVDKTVLARCAQIGKLRDPIEALLKGKDRDVG